MTTESSRLRVSWTVTVLVLKRITRWTSIVSKDPEMPYDPDRHFVVATRVIHKNQERDPSKIICVDLNLTS
ncbi:hypothetical protein Cni_G26789 [Canna indica]|uniref:Uncharacterized protein n=1 Tax=Canna indica TaxID=4628 RepID=A0AAQ3L4F4_9LILI|nr:hypothetical protein Cni_G26789 [Canna indica]